MMKRIKLHFLTVLTMTLLALTATAHDFEVDGIYYIINGTEATVTHQGQYGYSYDHEYSGHVSIPEVVTYDGVDYNVTSIGDEAFDNCSGLTSIEIPNSIKTIGGSAFFNCKGLTSVSIPNSVKSIGWNAFGSCSSILDLYIGESVSIIDEFAFCGCSGLTSVTIPKYVTTVGSFAFQGCNSLDTLNFNAISCADFSTHELDSDHPFYQVYLSTINIGDSVRRIPAYFAYGQSQLTNMNLNLPNSILEIGEGAFFYCRNLTGSLTIPSSVISIPNYAFCACSGLTSVILPNSITSIGKYAFDGCTSLTGIYISDLEAWCNISFGSPGANPLYEAKHLFLNNVRVTNLIIPSSIISIKGGLFAGCTDLECVTIPNSVTSIGNYAFDGCSGLTSVTCLAVTPPITSSNTFSGVTSQATLYVPRGSVAAYQTADHWKYFSQIVGIPAIDDFEVDGLWYRALDENTAMVIQRPDEDDLYSGDVVIPEAVTCQDITFSVTTIDAGAFEDCYELNSVVIGNAVESICENAFQGCTGLMSVTIGSGVTNIGAKAFNYCNALQTVTCRGTVPPVMASSNCFSNAAYSRAVLKVPRPEIETYAATDYWYKFSHIEGWGYLGPGDVNGDGVVGMDDLTRLITILVTDDLGGTDPTWADVNANGMVNMNDLTALINLLVFGHQ